MLKIVLHLTSFQKSHPLWCPPPRFLPESTPCVAGQLLCRTHQPISHLWWCCFHSVVNWCVELSFRVNPLCCSFMLWKSGWRKRSCKLSFDEWFVSPKCVVTGYSILIIWNTLLSYSICKLNLKGTVFIDLVLQRAEIQTNLCREMYYSCIENVKLVCFHVFVLMSQPS